MREIQRRDDAGHAHAGAAVTSRAGHENTPRLAILTPPRDGSREPVPPFKSTVNATAYIHTAGLISMITEGQQNLYLQHNKHQFPAVIGHVRFRRYMGENARNMITITKSNQY